MRKRLGYVAAWLLATTLATAISLTAVRLVGAQATESLGPRLPSVDSVATTTTTTGDAPIPVTGGTTSTIVDPVVPSIESISTTTATSAPDVTTTTHQDTTSTTVPTPSTTTATTTTTIGSTTSTTTPVSTGPFTFVMTGGSVTITCQTDDVSLNGAVPASGYTVNVEKSGPGEVRVEFTRDETEVEIRIECEDGVPIDEIDEN